MTTATAARFFELAEDLEAETSAGACPYCGELDDGFHGLDLRIVDEKGGRELDWIPCCEGMRDAVGFYGWEEVFGRELAADVAELFGLDALGNLLEDGTESFPLRVETATGAARDRVFEAVTTFHRHHDAPLQWKWGAECYNGRVRVGVAVVERPKARLLALAEPLTVEVSRVATYGAKALRNNASSALYAEVCREAARRGYTKVVTYTLESENGASLKAAGFRAVAETRGGSWSRAERQRVDHAPTCRKVRWEREVLDERARLDYLLARVFGT